MREGLESNMSDSSILSFRIRAGNNILLFTTSGEEIASNKGNDELPLVPKV